MELTYQEIEILAILAINTIESGEFCPGVKIHPTLVKRLESAHSKLVTVLDEANDCVAPPDSA